MTLRAAFILLSVAVLLGTLLAARRAGGLRFRGWWVGLAHGSAGAAGLLALAAALRAGAATGPFAWDAAGLAGIGLATGLAVVWLAWRRRSAPDALIVLHATLGGLGYLLLAGFALG